MELLFSLLIQTTHDVRQISYFMLHIFIEGESNGKLPLRTCPGCSVPEPYRSPEWALVPAPKLAQGLNTTNNCHRIIC